MSSIGENSMNGLHGITKAANNLFAFNLQKDGIFLNKRLSPAKKSKLIDHIVSLQTHLLIHKGVPRREPHGIVSDVSDIHGNHLEITLVLKPKKCWRLDVSLNGDDFIIQDLDISNPQVVLFAETYDHLQQSMRNPYRRESVVPLGYHEHQPGQLNGTFGTTFPNVNPWVQYRSQKEMPTATATTTMPDPDKFQRGSHFTNPPSVSSDTSDPNSHNRFGMKSITDKLRRPVPEFKPTNIPRSFSDTSHSNYPVDIIYPDVDKHSGVPPIIIGKSSKGFHIAIRVYGQDADLVNQVVEAAKEQFSIDTFLYNLNVAMGAYSDNVTDEFKDIYRLPQQAFIGMKLYTINVG